MGQSELIFHSREISAILVVIIRVASSCEKRCKRVTPPLQFERYFIRHHCVASCKKICFVYSHGLKNYYMSKHWIWDEWWPTRRVKATISLYRDVYRGGGPRGSGSLVFEPLGRSIFNTYEGWVILFYKGNWHTLTQSATEVTLSSSKGRCFLQLWPSPCKPLHFIYLLAIYCSHSHISWQNNQPWTENNVLCLLTCGQNGLMITIIWL